MILSWTPSEAAKAEIAIFSRASLRWINKPNCPDDREGN